MNTTALTPDDENLIQRASEICDRAFDPDCFDGAHIVAAAVQTTDGTVYDGVSLPANTGQACTCGEPVAVGSAVADGKRHDDIETCVAVAYPMSHHAADEIRVVPPCGTCREMLADYKEEMRVIVPSDGETQVVHAIDLLPARTW